MPLESFSEPEAPRRRAPRPKGPRVPDTPERPRPSDEPDRTNPLFPSEPPREPDRFDPTRPHWPKTRPVKVEEITGESRNKIRGTL